MAFHLGDEKRAERRTHMSSSSNVVLAKHWLLLRGWGGEQFKWVQPLVEVQATVALSTALHNLIGAMALLKGGAIQGW